MATILSTQNDLPLKVDDAFASMTSAASILVPLGRILFALIFVLSGSNHFSAGTINYAASQGIPMAGFLVPFSGVISVLGGLSIMIGFKARWGALLLLIFLVPVTLMMHNFWAVTDPMMHANQMAHFMKNISLMGACILIFYFGSGPTSLDNRTRKL